MSNHDLTSILVQLSDNLADAVEAGGKSVVAVYSRKRHNPASGIVWSPGVVVTADHVLERDEEITIAFADGAEVPATIAGRDPGSDVAILKFDHPAAVVATIGVEPRVGSLVLAVGRAPHVAATSGVVSAVSGPVRTSRGGQLDGFIRTDAVLYPGFSGGPLIDAAGRVIGLNTTHFGGGLALPVASVKSVVESLHAHGRIRKAFLGIGSQPIALPESLKAKVAGAPAAGLLIVSVVEQGPAEQGGLFVGDIIVAIAGQPVQDTDQLQQALTADKIGVATAIQVLRGGEPKTVTVTVGERK